MQEDDETEDAMQRAREASALRQRYTLRRFEAADSLIEVTPGPSGHISWQPYRGGPVDPSRYRVVRGGWDHEHCGVCAAKVWPGNEWWEAIPPAEIGLCLDCHANLFPDSRREA